MTLALFIYFTCGLVDCLSKCNNSFLQDVSLSSMSPTIHIDAVRETKCMDLYKSCKECWVGFNRDEVKKTLYCKPDFNKKY